MVEAPSILHSQPSVVIGTLARLVAKKAVKHQLRAKGLKLSHFAARELSRLADDYLDQHRAELMAQTWEWVQSAPSLRELYDKEQRNRQPQLERQRRAQVVQRTTNNQTVSDQSVKESQ